MYKKILVSLDNSKYSGYCIDIGIAFAERLGAELTGSHVYSAGLHDRRFRDMETGLPEHYQQEERLRKSRQVHDSLIGDGLRLISDAYLESFKKGCTKAGVPFSCKLMEGKNWLEIITDIRNSGYDLVIMGVLGLGAVNGNLIGGVCERVARKVQTDILVVKEGPADTKKIIVAIDGSSESFLALEKALVLGQCLGAEVEAVAVYDPHFHRRAFQALVGVLSEEAGKRFKFTEQEKLHDEIIDDGLGKIYQGYLDRAYLAGINKGVRIKTVLLTGKAYMEINDYISANHPSMLVAGRFGAHRAEESDIGNTAENLVRLAPCNVLLTCGAGAV